MFVQNIFAFINVVFLLFEVLFVAVSFSIPSKDRAQKDKKNELNKLPRYYETSKGALLMEIYQV